VTPRHVRTHTIDGLTTTHAAGRVPASSDGAWLIQVVAGARQEAHTVPWEASGGTTSGGFIMTDSGFGLVWMLGAAVLVVTLFTLLVRRPSGRRASQRGGTVSEAAGHLAPPGGVDRPVEAGRASR